MMWTPLGPLWTELYRNEINKRKTIGLVFVISLLRVSGRKAEKDVLLMLLKLSNQG